MGAALSGVLRQGGNFWRGHTTKLHLRQKPEEEREKERRKIERERERDGGGGAAQVRDSAGGWGEMAGRWRVKRTVTGEHKWDSRIVVAVGRPSSL